MFLLPRRRQRPPPDPNNEDDNEQRTSSTSNVSEEQTNVGGQYSRSDHNREEQQLYTSSSYSRNSQQESSPQSYRHSDHFDNQLLSPFRTWIEEARRFRTTTSSVNGGMKFDKSLVVLLLLIDAIFCCFILYFVPYTEIDWKAYMQEVESFQNGERDYYQIKGDTGPLVYPAGFVYIFAILRSLTGGNYFAGQIIFAIIYIIQIAFVLLIAQSTSNKDALLLSLVIASKRLHSIYLLRCFNDGIAMTFAFASIFTAQRRRWVTTCILFSLGVSVKMNVLLFAPALLWLLYDQASGHKILQTCFYLSICALVQIILGLPFLLHHPVHYIHRAFELGRVFKYTWTVNWKFIPESIFLSPSWSILLLLCHITVLIGLWKRIWIRNRNLTLSKEVFQTYVAFVFYSSNFVGILFARSLHYQFYSWYFPTIPFLLCHSHGYRVVKVFILIVLEFCWNVYPQRPEVSLILLFVHILLLIGIFNSPLKDLWRREFVSSSSINAASSTSSTPSLGTSMTTKMKDQ